MAIIVCPECQEKISDTVRQCVHCGAKISVCPECKMVYAKEINVCTECGCLLNRIENQSKNEESELSSAKDVMSLWKKEKTMHQYLFTNTIWLVLIVASVIFVAIAAFQLLSWNNDVFKAEETFSNIKTMLTFAAVFFVLQSVYNSLGNFYKTILLSAWCVGKKVDFKFVLSTTLKKNFDAMTLDEAGEELGGAQWCIIAATYAQNAILRYKQKKLNIIKVCFVVVSAIFLLVFALKNIEIYMQAEIWKSDILGTTGFEFSMIEDWILLIISAVAYIVRLFLNKLIDKNEEKACDAWVSENLSDCAKEYSKYAKAESMAEYFLKRAEKASK